MSPAYQALVLRHYEKKRDKDELSFRLKSPTAARLKEECLAKFAEGFSQNDRKILVDFFGGKAEDEAILKRIEGYHPDLFKPLLNYINNKIGKPNPKNVELLAWLTDFEDRPYDRLKNYSLDDLQTDATTQETFLNATENEGKKEEQDGQTGKNKIVEVEDVEETPTMSASIIADKPPIKQVNDGTKKAQLIVSSTIISKHRYNWKAIIAILVVALLTAAVIFMYSGKGENGQKNKMGSTLNIKGGCMYWAEDHYQQVPCSQKMGDDTLVIALDMERLNSLKRITREDTITRNSKGWVWYVKHNNKVEFYTAGGNYPLDPTVRLKPITDYIIDKYIDSIP